MGGRMELTREPPWPLYGWRFVPEAGRGGMPVFNFMRASRCSNVSSSTSEYLFYAGSAIIG